MATQYIHARSGIGFLNYKPNAIGIQFDLADSKLKFHDQTNVRAILGIIADSGAGTSSSPYTDGGTAGNFAAFWTQSTATSGDSRLLYLRQYFAAAGSGEVLRIFATATAANVATGGTVNGAHISFSYSGASATISGQAHAARLTLGADAQTRTLNGNVAVLNVDSDVATGNTVPNTVAFIKVTDTSNVRINQLLRLPVAANSTLVATHITDAMTHSVRCVLNDGTLIYVMATTTATNRGGGS